MFIRLMHSHISMMSMLIYDDLLHNLPGSTANRKDSVIPAQPFHQVFTQVTKSTKNIWAVSEAHRPIFSSFSDTEYPGVSESMTSKLIPRNPFSPVLTAQVNWFALKQAGRYPISNSPSLDGRVNDDLFTFVELLPHQPH